MSNETAEKRRARVPLIVDADAAFLESLRAEAASLPDGSEPLCAASVDAALQIIGENMWAVSCLIVGTRIGHENVKNLVFAALRTIPGLPIILISEWTSSEFTEEELRRMVVQTVVQKPIRYNELMARLSYSTTPKAVPRAQRKDADFTPIELSAVPPTEHSEDDVYVRIRADRYVKILRAGSVIGNERLDRYARKGLLSFYKYKKAGGG